MAFYTIGDVAERCGINPVTLRAWQRRYELLKPKRTEGGHRQFDDEDIQRIEEIKRWIESGVSVGKVKALLDESSNTINDAWRPVQEEMMMVLRQARPIKLRTLLADLEREYDVGTLIDNIFTPVRQRLTLDHNTAQIMSSLLDGALIECAVSSLVSSRNSKGKPALFIGWGNPDRTCIWLEAWRLSLQGWHIDVLAEPLEIPRPELFPGQQMFLWTGKKLTSRQQEQLAHWQEQGYSVTAHSG